MVIILETTDNTPNSISIKFILNSKFRKKGSTIISNLASAYFTNSMSREIYIEPDWIREVTLKLDKKYPDKEVAYFIVRYQPGNIQLAAEYKNKVVSATLF